MTSVKLKIIFSEKEWKELLGESTYGNISKFKHFSTENKNL